MAAEDICTICCDAITDNITIECGHSFHTECAMRWFRFESTACPNCRSDVQDDTWESMSSDTRIRWMKKKRKALPPELRRRVDALIYVEKKMRLARHTHRTHRQTHRAIFKKEKRLQRELATFTHQYNDLTDRLYSEGTECIPLMVRTQTEGVQPDEQ